jgi:hypothetical protein
MTRAYVRGSQTAPRGISVERPCYGGDRPALQSPRTEPAPASLLGPLEGRCRVIEYRVSALWELAGARMEEKSAGERWRKVVGAHRIWSSAQRHRRIVASCQRDRMRPFLEGLSVGRRLGVATPAGHGLQGKSPWMRRRRSSQLRQQL